MSGADERQRAIGERVARLRRRRGLTRQQFADLCGRSLSWAEKIEYGERALVRLPMLQLVAEVLHVSVETLTEGPGVQPAGPCLDAFEVSAIRDALQRYQAISRVFVPAPRSEAPDLGRLGQQVIYAWTSFQQARYTALGRLLPELLRDGQDAVAAHAGADETALVARTLLSQTYQVTASALWKLKETDLAWLAAERGLTVEEQTDDTLLISDAARRVAQGLMTTSHPLEALGLLRADIARLEPGRGTASGAYLSLYGMLFLMGSVVAGRASRGAVARELLAEGHSVAAQLGADGNERFTAFGPTNVRLHEVAVLVDLGDGGAAVRVARDVDPSGLGRLPKERRANFFVDVARAHAQERQRDEAVGALLEAERLAPDEVRCRPVAADLIDELARRTPGAPSARLEGLAARVGLSARG